MSRTRVSIIIPHYNDLAGLARCLNSLDAQTYPKEQTAIIVVDNASPIDREHILEVVGGRATLLTEDKKGAGPARNCGVEAAQTEFICFIDSDCLATPGWLEAGLTGLERYDFCGGPVNVHIDHDGPLSPSEAFEVVFAFDNKAYIEKKGFTGSGNLFTTKTVFEKVGGFGVGLSEDLDWSHRARSQGFVLGYVPAAAIGHPARSNWQELKRKWLRIQSETRALAPSGLANNAKWLLRTWAMPLSIIAHAPRIWRSTQLQSTQNRFAALRGLTRQRLWRFIDGHRLLLGLKRS